MFAYPDMGRPTFEKFEIMEDLQKVSSMQLYLFWRNLSIGLLSVIAIMTLSKLLPFYLSPIISLIGAAVLYTVLYNNKMSGANSCMLVPYAIFFCLISYSFTAIVINVLYAWGFILPPRELVFFNEPYLPSLLLNPVCFLTLLVIYFRRNHLNLCSDCHIHTGNNYERGKLGNILSYESHYQLRNLTILFGVLSVVIWGYYKLFYVNISVNDRDWYIFTWLTIIAFVIDEVYFIARYYNLFLDLKENNEIITPSELRDMTAKTYLRFYVVCGNDMYVDQNTVNRQNPFHTVIDTPFFTKRSVNGITVPEVKKIISKMTGVDDGDLRFFFGRKLTDFDHHSILRYFYFLKGNISDYPDLKVKGEWMNFDLIKKIYSTDPKKLSPTAVGDITRLATIILTEKIFDENGFRKSRIKNYNPGFNLIDVKKSRLNFQDDKWIKISMFNSDNTFYRLRKWWRGLLRSKAGQTNSWG